MSKELIIFFLRYPSYGKVKTRLAKRLGNEITLELYKSFVLDHLLMLNQSDVVQSSSEKGKTICISYTPIESENQFKNWLGNEYLYTPQKGNDLGQRMCNAFQSGFKLGYDKIILVGSDFPGLPVTIINQSFEQLNDYDSTIGETYDGGYYLIGFTKDSFCEKVFQNIKWSTSFVFKKTISILEDNNLTIHNLPIWRDIDTFEDLIYFYSKNKDRDFETIKMMKKFIDSRKILLA